LVATAAALLAGLIGTLVAKAALSPINRFTERTEAVTGALHGPRRLDGGGTTGLQRLVGGGATELQRLAHSFNQTLDALEISMQAQRHLIADASHELRTPMAALRSNIQIFLEAEALPREERAELQQAILAELDELTQLVADVLDLARGASPSDHIESVELDTELEPTVISNAPERVTRAIGNVIDNARKWSPPEGPIEVTLRDGVLRVRDHGPGFKQSDIEHVFDRFYRADEARRLPGSGLGLAIVRQAAEAYGGTVIATNAEDGGAVIEVAFGSRPAGGLLQNS
jgi:two-component system sensor histidine kinase MprB